MEEIKRQVKRAQQRLVLERFRACVVGRCSAPLVIAAIGLAIPRIWVLSTIEQLRRRSCRLDQQERHRRWLALGWRMDLHDPPQQARRGN